jgi:hypothetical protein
MTQQTYETGALQAFRERNALIRAVRTLLKGSGLDIRERARGLVISNPGHPEHGRIYITYISGEVSHCRTTWDYLGHIHGHGSADPDDEPPVNTDTIIGALTGQPGTPP